MAGGFKAAMLVAVSIVTAGALHGSRAAARDGSAGAPRCVRVGTRSEGWAWPSGRFIHWAKCKGVAPTCLANGKQGAGWYARGALIAADACHPGAGASSPGDAAPDGGAEHSPQPVQPVQDL